MHRKTTAWQFELLLVVDYYWTVRLIWCFLEFDLLKSDQSRNCFFLLGRRIGMWGEGGGSSGDDETVWPAGRRTQRFGKCKLKIWLLWSWWSLPLYIVYVGVGWWKCRGPEISHSCGLTVSCLTCGKTGDGNRNTLKNTYKISYRNYLHFGNPQGNFSCYYPQMLFNLLINIVHALLYDI